MHVRVKRFATLRQELNLVSPLAGGA